MIVRKLGSTIRAVGHLLAVKLARGRGIVDPRPVVDAQGKLVAIVTNTLMGNRQQRPRQASGRDLVVRQKPPERLRMRCVLRAVEEGFHTRSQLVGAVAVRGDQFLITPLQPRFEF